MPWTHQVSACEQPWFCFLFCPCASPSTASLPAVCDSSGQCLYNPALCFPRHVVATVPVFSTIQSHECWCNKKKKLYIPSHCFKWEHHIHDVLNEQLLSWNMYKRRRKNMFSILYQRTTRTFKTIISLYFSITRFGLVFCLLLNWRNLIQFGREIRTAEHCCISQLLTADCFMAIQVLSLSN